MAQFDEEINTINSFGGTFQGAAEVADDEMNFAFTKGGGDDPIQTLTISVKGIDAKDVTTNIT